MEKTYKSIYRKKKKIKNQLEKHEKYMKLLDYCRNNILRLNPIILDIEATGFRREDEILQLSIIDLNSKVLFNEYMKPKIVEEWEESQNIHGITKEMVENKKNFSYYRKNIEKILKKHKLIIGYAMELDLALLNKFNVNLKDNIILDISYLAMLLYDNKELSDKKIPSLKDVSNYYGYDFIPHNSLNDVKATLYCLKSLLVEKMENFTFKYDETLFLEEVNDEKKIRNDKLYNLANKFIDIYQEPSNKIILDLETTGIREDDEIIQLSIIDLKGNVLFDEYIKPSKVEEWEDAYKIHKISKDMLEDKHKIEYYRKDIQKILDNVEYMIGYGISFDYKLLKRQGFNVDRIKKIDISEYFKYLYRKILKDPKAKRPKLIECSNFYGFKENDFHNSLIDCYATLTCYNGIYKDMRDEIDGNFEC